MTVKFDATEQEIADVDAIVAHLLSEVPWAPCKKASDLSSSIKMDLIATHANGCPMDFDRMRAEDREHRRAFQVCVKRAIHMMEVLSGDGA
ncbi:hypothetical protein [Acetobacter cerevisiae]|uniref:hypothetical protein n=1 Tax=Acetobacter cerevisiae TaxID=178900 RepID=UPI0020A1B634|nr:hypothetical protein [Acetobacter cerevisiae]MCP1271253.1 hypothetical protein [Acetobacter cerevisiae]MCP1279207.1 hypothetical protein [Acetobacter cerevisiae]